jgi:hypothetical protein
VWTTLSTTTRTPIGIEAIEIVRHMGFSEGNAVKYLWRLEHKDGPKKNLQKAVWYITDEINNRRAHTLATNFPFDAVIKAGRAAQAEENPEVRVAMVALVHYSMYHDQDHLMVALNCINRMLPQM